MLRVFRFISLLSRGFVESTVDVRKLIFQGEGKDYYVVM